MENALPSQSSDVHASRAKPWLSVFLASLSLIMIGYLFGDGIVEMENRWATMDEYSHGYMIPLVALFLFYQKLPKLISLNWQASWSALILIVCALLGWLLGEMSSLFIIVHYSFLLALFALAIAVFGLQGLRLIWASLIYLVFMIPLPTFLYNGLSQSLQMISTEIGVAVINLFDISVYVSGNVIDLGVYQLQVAEACSGLRYLFPLMSFGFLIAYVYEGSNFQKWIIFLSAIPISVLMNSFRIGVIGVTVEYWGIEMAEGFLHDFEGWFVFLACLGVMFLEIYVISFLAGRRANPLHFLDLSYPDISEIRNSTPGERNTTKVLIPFLIFLIAALPISKMISTRTEIIPQRTELNVFPLLLGDWMGQESSIAPNILDALDHPDYIISDYRRSSFNIPVNFYAAYYESQRKGSSIHSPRSCIPGGGWRISDLSQQSMSHIEGIDKLRVNRLIISKDKSSQLVYYWFAQRGRILTNEYLTKWYLLQDGLTMKRTDGALIRLVTPVPEGTDMADADQRLQDFLQTFYPIMPEYFPGFNE